MVCPKCSGPMATRQRTGVYVEQCSNCLGIFLDRRELALLVRAENEFNDDFSDQTTGSWGEGKSHHSGQGTHHGQQTRHGDGGQRRRSFLENLFD